LGVGSPANFYLQARANKGKKDITGTKTETRQGNLFLYIIESLYINLYGLSVVLLNKQSKTQ